MKVHKKSIAAFVVAINLCFLAISQGGSQPSTQSLPFAKLAGIWEEDITAETENTMNAMDLAQSSKGEPKVFLTIKRGSVQQGFHERTDMTQMGLVQNLSPITMVIADKSLKLRIPKKGDIVGAQNAETGADYAIQREEEQEYLVDSFELSIEPDGSHFRIKLANKSADGKKTIYLGIAQVDANSLRICWALPGKDRPTAIPSKAGLNFVMRRIKNISQDKAK